MSSGYQYKALTLTEDGIKKLYEGIRSLRGVLNEMQQQGACIKEFTFNDVGDKKLKAECDYLKTLAHQLVQKHEETVNEQLQKLEDRLRDYQLRVPLTLGEETLKEVHGFISASCFCLNMIIVDKGCCIHLLMKKCGEVAIRKNLEIVTGKLQELSSRVRNQSVELKSYWGSPWSDSPPGT